MREHLSAVCGELMDEMDTEVHIARSQMYVLRTRLKIRNISVAIGFWLPGGHDGFPIVYGDARFEAKAKGKEAIVAAMLNFVRQNKRGWKAEDVSMNSSWGRIVNARSLASFLGEPDHVAAIRSYLHDLIADIAEFKTQHPKLVWTI
jgi:hypothetical protein